MRTLFDDVVEQLKADSTFLESAVCVLAGVYGQSLDPKAAEYLGSFCRWLASGKSLTPKQSEVARRFCKQYADLLCRSITATYDTETATALVGKNPVLRLYLAEPEQAAFAPALPITGDQPGFYGSW